MGKGMYEICFDAVEIRIACMDTNIWKCVNNLGVRYFGYTVYWVFFPFIPLIFLVYYFLFFFYTPSYPSPCKKKKELHNG